MAYETLCPEITNPPVQVYIGSTHSWLTSGLILPLQPKRDVSCESSTSSSREMCFIGQWNHIHRNRSRQFHRSLHVVPRCGPLLSWLASGLYTFRKVLSDPSERSVASWCLEPEKLSSNYFRETQVNSRNYPKCHLASFSQTLLLWGFPEDEKLKLHRLSWL